MGQSDHNYDTGSLYTGPDGWRVIGPTEAGPQADQTGGEMVVWTSGDEGKTWTKKQQITAGSVANHSYARRPVGAKSPFYAFWADGNPTAFGESRLYFTDSTGTRHWQLPYQMKTATAAPVEMRPAGVNSR